MDVETIQKINTLALDLMRQGLANSRDDAVAQAEKIYYKGTGNETYDSIRRNMGDSLSSTNVTPSSKSSSSSNASDLPQEKVQEILEANTKFLVKTIKEFQEKMAQMEKDISSLRSTQTMYRQQATERSQVMETSSATSARPAASSPAPSPTSSAANHPRSGNYKEGDVSIEKFFYMGNKR